MEMAMRHYVLWGLPEDESNRLHEVVLLSEGTKEQCDDVEAIAAADGFHGFRRTLLEEF